MSDQPELLTAPYSPSPQLIRRKLEAEKLEEVKAHFWIRTHCSKRMTPAWLAVAVDRGETRDVGQVMAEECGAMDDAGRLFEADTELEAVMGLVRRTYPGFEIDQLEEFKRKENP